MEMEKSWARAHAIKYNHYTLLNGRRVRVLEYGLSVELMSYPKKAHTPLGANKAKECKYHQNHDHSTEDWRDRRSPDHRNNKRSPNSHRTGEITTETTKGMIDGGVEVAPGRD
ncbi:hypothetical protein VNO78_26805 [Psophocarpus tetragonolobus]|uniref:Uncharacterized protein n=1 Tax=Psophocarpus tetragonolobus TaxID=3891 RepID=A0AAN9S022_PSOTE